jgi:hypothetical protein
VHLITLADPYEMNYFTQTGFQVTGNASAISVSHTRPELNQFTIVAGTNTTGRGVGCGGRIDGEDVRLLIGVQVVVYIEGAIGWNIDAQRVIWDRMRTFLGKR